jgi:queuine tRNA-ribosyltransferase
VFPDLREESARFIASIDLPGYAIGGLSVGETKAEMHGMLEKVNAILPEEKPRYLMGVGSPEDLVNGVLRGVDMFDCVLPTRLARHHAAMTGKGRLNLMNAIFARQEEPIEDGCDCYACRNFSRAYLRHLIMSKEMLAGTLLSIHNLRMLVRLVGQMRNAILEGTFENFANQFLEQYEIGESPSLNNELS